jgi:hypothetical protein
VADQLITPAELASLLQQDVDTATANLVINAATAAVQGACGKIPQRLVRVIDDTAELIGLTSSYLRLPQRRVVSITSVTLDGTAVTAGAPGSLPTTYRLVGNQLWRTNGWQTYIGEPSNVDVVYTHGYLAGDQRLELARGAVGAISKSMYINPAGVASEKIDDYAVSYAKALSEAQGQLDASPFLGKALRNQYGPETDLVRLG